MSAPSGILSPGELAQIERLAVHLDRPVGAGFAGAHRSRHHGRSLDFADWRDYQPGDDPRSIDVQAWARLDQVLVRLYEADVDLSVQLVVDTSGSMAAGDKLRQGTRVAAAIAAMALVRNESVTVTTLERWAPRRYRGRGAIPLLLAEMSSWTPAGPTPLAAIARHLSATPRRAGLIVVVSDFLTDDWTAAIDQFAARKEQLVALAITSIEDDSPDLAGEVQLLDIESGDRVDVDATPEHVAAFSRRRAARRRAIEHHLARTGGRFLEVAAGEDLIAAVMPKLLGSGITR